MSGLEFVRMKNCPNWNLSEVERGTQNRVKKIRLFKKLNWKIFLFMPYLNWGRLLFGNTC